MKAIGMFNGKITDINEPVIKLEDRGYQYGDGVYDAWPLINGTSLFLEQHLDRFEKSGNLLGITPTFNRQEIIEIIDNMIAASGLTEAFIYLQWTRGWISPRSHINDPNAKANLSGLIFPFQAYHKKYTTEGVKTYSYPDLRHSFCHIKSLNLIGNVLAQNEATKKGGYEAILVREMRDGDFVTECAQSSSFAVKDNILYTAPNGKYILPGITRGVIIDLAKNNGIKVVEEFSTLDFYLNADEALLTGSSKLAPITYLDDQPIGDGKVGPVVKKLMSLYHDLVDEVCHR